LQGQLEQGDYLVIHELSRDCTTSHSRELIFNKANVLGDLNNANLILPALCLNWNDVMATTFIKPDIQLVDLNLTDAFQPTRNSAPYSFHTLSNVAQAETPTQKATRRWLLTRCNR
jgi:hypothetical protein